LKAELSASEARRAALTGQGFNAMRPQEAVGAAQLSKGMDEQPVRSVETAALWIANVEHGPTNGVTIDGATDPLKLGGTAEHAGMFVGLHEHRVVDAGHNLPQQAPQPFADAVIKVRDWFLLERHTEVNVAKLRWAGR
jgi:hypothetical protein